MKAGARSRVEWSFEKLVRDRPWSSSEAGGHPGRERKITAPLSGCQSGYKRLQNIHENGVRPSKAKPQAGTTTSLDAPHLSQYASRECLTPPQTGHFSYSITPHAGHV